MIKPVLQDDAFLAELAAGDKDREHFHLWWLRQSGFLVQWQGQHLLLDPYLSDSLTKKYANTDQPHVRMTDRVILPERLSFIRVVAASHAHTDHLDPETLRPLAAVNPHLVVVCPEATRVIARERSGLPDERIIGLNARFMPGAEGREQTAHAHGPRSQVQSPSFRVTPGTTRAQESDSRGRHRPRASCTPPLEASVGAFTFHAVPAAHETVDRDAQGCCLYLGFVVRFGPWTIYHSGDTVRFDGMVDWLRPWRIDVALLPINGRAPERRVAGNLSGGDAARLARDIGARVAVPCHYDMFEFNTATPDEFVATARGLDQPHAVLRCGERWTSARLGSA